MDPSASTDSADPSLGARLARAWTSPLGRAFRVVLAFLPFAWIARRVDLDTVLRGMRAVGFVALAQGLFVQLANSLFVSWRWRLLMSAYGAPRDRLPSVLYLFRTNLVGNYTALLPVPLADDAVRGLRTMHVFPDSRATPYLVLLAERTIGLAGVAILGGIAFAIQGHRLPSLVARILGVGIGTAIVLSLVAIVAPRLLEARPAMRDRISRIPLVGFVARVPAPKRFGGLLAPLVISVVGHFLSAGVIWWLMSRLDPHATLAVCTQMQPLVLIVMALPLTPVGLGQRELAFAATYGLAGVATASAVTTSILSLSLALTQALIGGLVFTVEKAVGARIPPSSAD